MPPATAAQIAKDEGIIIHTISVGDPTAAGEDALDVDSLKGVATTSGGIYAHAEDRQQLEEIYRKIDALETRKAETISHRPKRDVYWLPLAVGFGVSLLQHALQLIVNRPPSRLSSSNAVAIDRERQRGTRMPKHEEVAV